MKTITLKITGHLTINLEGLEPILQDLQIHQPPTRPDSSASSTIAQIEGVPSSSAFIDEKQLLEQLSVSRRTLYNWRESGKIPCVRLVGRRILFHWPSVEAALLRNQRGGAGW